MVTYRQQQARRTVRKHREKMPPMPTTKRGKSTRLKAALATLPEKERREVYSLMKAVADGQKGLAVSHMENMILARARHEAQSADDGRRRTLIGARIPRQTVERYRITAEQSGRSLYRFVVDAVEREYRYTTKEVMETDPALGGSRGE